MQGTTACDRFGRTFGSSCRWNQVRKFLWYRQLCFLSSRAARYCKSKGGQWRKTGKLSQGQRVRSDLVRGALLEVEDEEERIRAELLKDGRVVEDRGRNRCETGRHEGSEHEGRGRCGLRGDWLAMATAHTGERSGRAVRIARHVGLRPARTKQQSSVQQRVEGSSWSAPLGVDGVREVAEAGLQRAQIEQIVVRKRNAAGTVT